MKLASKLLWIVVLVTAIPTSTITGFLAYREWSSSSQRELESNRILIAAVYPLLLSSYWNFDKETIGKAMEALLASKSIQAIKIYDDEGALFEAADQNEEKVKLTSLPQLRDLYPEIYRADALDEVMILGFSEQTPYVKQVGSINYRVMIPLIFYDSSGTQRKIKGFLIADFSLWELRQRLSSTIFFSIMFTLLFISLLVSIMLILLQHSVVRPVRSLAQSSKTISEGNFESPVTIPSNDEIGDLALNFEDMRLKMKSYTQMLKEKNEMLELTLEDLQHEVTSRVAMVGDLAHRGNNPIHAGNLALENIADELQKMRELISHLFAPYEKLDDEGRLCFDTIHKILEDSHNELCIAQETRILVQQAIQDIRVLGGVDGTNIEIIEMKDIIHLTQVRLKSSLTPADQARLEWLDHPVQESFRVFANKDLIAICLERFMRQVLLESQSDIPIIVEGSPSPDADHIFTLSFSHIEAESNSRLIELCNNLSYIMKGFDASFSWEGRSLHMKCLLADNTSLDRYLA